MSINKEDFETEKRLVDLLYYKSIFGKKPVTITEELTKTVCETFDFISSLPSDQQQNVILNLLLATAQVDSVGDIEPIRQFFQSLRLTIELNKDPEYRRAMETAPEEPEYPGQDIAEVIAELRLA